MRILSKFQKWLSSHFLQRSPHSEVLLSILLEQTDDPIRYCDFKAHYLQLGMDMNYLNFVKDIIDWYACAYIVCNLRMNLKDPIFDSILKLVDKVDLELDRSTIPEWMDSSTGTIITEYFLESSTSSLEKIDKLKRVQVLRDYKQGKLGMSIFQDVFEEIFYVILRGSYKSFEDSRIRSNIVVVDKINRMIFLSFASLLGIGLSILLNSLNSPIFLVFFLMLPFGYIISYFICQIATSFCPNAAKANIRFTLYKYNHAVTEIKEERVTRIQHIKSKQQIFLSKLFAILLSFIFSYGIQSHRVYK